MRQKIVNTMIAADSPIRILSSYRRLYRRRFTSLFVSVVCTWGISEVEYMAECWELYEDEIAAFGTIVRLCHQERCAIVQEKFMAGG
jgi:hypothetical protein